MTNLNLDQTNTSEPVSVVSINNKDARNDDDTSEEQISPAERSLLQKIIRKGLVETTADVQKFREDPASPLHSVKSFEALHL